jgi:hypothetical protein
MTTTTRADQIKSAARIARRRHSRQAPLLPEGNAVSPIQCPQNVPERRTVECDRDHIARFFKMSDSKVIVTEGNETCAGSKWLTEGERERDERPSRLGTTCLRAIPQLPKAGRVGFGVRFGHSAMSAQCPICPKADTAGRFMSTPLMRAGDLLFPQHITNHGAQRHRVHRLVQQMVTAGAGLTQQLWTGVAADQEGRNLGGKSPA